MARGANTSNIKNLLKLYVSTFCVNANEFACNFALVALLTIVIGVVDAVVLVISSLIRSFSWAVSPWCIVGHGA